MHHSPPKEYSNSTYVAANFGGERRNLFEEEPVSIDPNADSVYIPETYIPIDNTSPLKVKMP